MFIAFEGPDNVGKSTRALELDHAGQPDYNATKVMHEVNQRDMLHSGLMPHTYDRIDWFSHMIYRLALPTREWNDDRVRTVFGMPDTHLVVSIHRPDTADFTADEVVDTPIKIVNQAYYLGVDFLGKLNYAGDYNLFKSITVMEVVNTPGEDYSQRVVFHDNPQSDQQSPDRHHLWNLIDSNTELLKFLQDVEHQLL